MTFILEDDYIQLYKLLKVLNLANSGAHAKQIILQGDVKRNKEVELRKRAKIRADEIIEIGDIKITILDNEKRA